MYAENYKTLMKEIKDETNRYRHIPYFQIGRMNILKMTTIPKAIYRFSGIPINNGIFHRIRTKNFPIFIETQNTTNSQSNLKKNRAGGLRLPDFILY